VISQEQKERKEEKRKGKERRRKNTIEAVFFFWSAIACLRFNTQLSRSSLLVVLEFQDNGKEKEEKIKLDKRKIRGPFAFVERTVQREGAPACSCALRLT